MNFKPMRPHEIRLEDIELIPVYGYPMRVVAVPDGLVRCITMPPVPGSPGLSIPSARRGRPIHNDHIRNTLSALLPGYDGLLHLFDAKGAEVHQGTCRKRGTPKFTYLVLDYIPVVDRTPEWHMGHPTAHLKRIAIAEALIDACVCPQAAIAPPRHAHSLDDLQRLRVIDRKFGLRTLCWTPHCPYKFGRCTLKNGWHFEII